MSDPARRGLIARAGVAPAADTVALPLAKGAGGSIYADSVLLAISERFRAAKANRLAASADDEATLAL